MELITETDQIIKALDDEKTRWFISHRLQKAFERLDLPTTQAKILVDEVIETARTVTDDIIAEIKLKSLLHEWSLADRLKQRQFERSQLMFSQIKDFVCGPTILDVGCGDGYTALLLQEQGYYVSLADILDYRAENLSMPFDLLEEGSSLPYDTSAFDTTLLLTVLHHSENPIHLLSECKRVTRKRIVIIESVFGIDSSAPFAPTQEENMFISLGDEQYWYAIFVDWFYNRVLHNDVPVPYNFKTPDEWDRVFRNIGLNQIHTEFLGLDQVLVPEFHTLHVLEAND